MHSADVTHLLDSSCHCGAVRLFLAAAPEQATSCDGLTLDFDQSDAFPVQHLAFRVSEPDFDRIVHRLAEHGIPYRSTPHGPVDMQVNTRYGGRIVYWDDPDGHVWEALTVSYARRPALRSASVR